MTCGYIEIFMCQICAKSRLTQSSYASHIGFERHAVTQRGELIRLFHAVTCYNCKIDIKTQNQNLDPLGTAGYLKCLVDPFSVLNWTCVWLGWTTPIATLMPACNTLHTMGPRSLLRKLPTIAKLTEKPYIEWLWRTWCTQFGKRMILTESTTVQVCSVLLSNEFQTSFATPASI